MTIDEVKKLLHDLVAEVNALSLVGNSIRYHEQRKNKKNMAIILRDRKSRIYVQPVSNGCDVSPSGSVLEQEIYPFMRKLFQKDCDGYKHPGRSVQPFWRTNDAEKVRTVIFHAAGVGQETFPGPLPMSEVPVEQGPETVEKWLRENERLALGLPMAELGRRAAAASSVPRKIVSNGSCYFIRDYNISSYVKTLADGRCDLCRQPAPFVTKDGPFLESHHLVWLSQGGKDSIDNVVALCPNCHRKMHHLRNEEDICALRKRILGRIA